MRMDLSTPCRSSPCSDSSVVLMKTDLPVGENSSCREIFSTDLGFESDWFSMWATWAILWQWLVLWVPSSSSLSLSLLTSSREDFRIARWDHVNQGEHCSLSIVGRCLVISDRPTDVILRSMFADRLSSELNHWNHPESRLLWSPKRWQETVRSWPTSLMTRSCVGKRTSFQIILPVFFRWLCTRLVLRRGCCCCCWESDEALLPRFNESFAVIDGTRSIRVRDD